MPAGLNALFGGPAFRRLALEGFQVTSLPGKKMISEKGSQHKHGGGGGLKRRKTRRNDRLGS